MLVHDFLQLTAARCPSKLALIANGQRLTYVQLDGMANRMARALVERGIAHGDRVVVHLENSIETVVSIFAALKAGAVCVPVSDRTKPVKLAYILNNCQAAAFVTSAATHVMALWTGVPSLRFTVVAGAEEDAPSAGSMAFSTIQRSYSAIRPPERSTESDLACLIYTPGTMGRPRGVMCDHGNLVFDAGAIMQYLHSTAADVVIVAMPLSTDDGLHQLFVTFGCGGTLVLEKSIDGPAHVLRRIGREKVTGLPGTPGFFAMILQMDLPAFDLRSLRYIAASSALPPDQLHMLRRKLPWVTLYPMFRLAGKEVWIEDAAGNRAGPGQIGELVMRGRHARRGYWKAPQETARRFRPGPIPGERLYYTGDLFRMDEEGYLYFVGRTDDIIKRAER